jgi:hypothetical protein
MTELTELPGTDLITFIFIFILWHHAHLPWSWFMLIFASGWILNLFFILFGKKPPPLTPRR